jgi:hypothetical protein
MDAVEIGRIEEEEAAALQYPRGYCSRRREAEEQRLGL